MQVVRLVLDEKARGYLFTKKSKPLSNADNFLWILMSKAGKLVDD